MQRPSMSRSAAFLAIALAACVFAPAVTYAQSVIVLGVRSLDGDDEFARNLTGALRHAASQVGDWEVSEREVTLAQMALAHGCDDPNPSCMAEIADSLSTQRVIYGDVRRTSAEDQFDFSLSLHLFNAESDQIEQSVADTIPGIRTDIDDLREPVRRYVAALSGAPRTGTLRIVAQPGAEVFIDGEAVGTADAEGRFEVADLEAGTRNVRIAAEGFEPHSSQVAIEPYGEASLEADLDAVAGASGGGGTFPTEIVVDAGLLAVAVGLAATWIWSWNRVTNEIQNDPAFVTARASQPETVENICATIGPSDAGYATVSGLCGEADTLEVLQFVFAVSAAAVGGAGIYFLLQGVMGDDADSDQAWMLVPTAGPDSAGLRLFGTF
ncbi:MAG TPA: hypothetical protein DEF51_22035 [Myxococcales bacterium]|nr:hypothetical protein [Myxococcales bacterium]